MKANASPESRHRIFALLVAALVTTAATGVAHAQLKNPDIVGLKIGMTPDEVRAVLKKHAPEMDVKETSSWQPSPGVPASLAVLTGCLEPQRAGCRETINVTFTQFSKRAYHIYRNNYFPEKAQPLWADVRNAVIEKYGEPHAGSLRDQPRWGFDTSGKPNKLCIGAGSSQAPLNPTPGLRGGAPADCGLSAGAYIAPAGNNLAALISVGLLNEQLLVEDLKTLDATVKAHQQGVQDKARSVPKTKL